MIASKEEERKALNKIKKIVEGLGENSYIAAAFDGCFEIAESNIEDDFCCSMKQKAEAAEKKESEAQGKIAALECELEKLEKDSKADLELAYLVSEKKEVEIATLREQIIPAGDMKNIANLISKKISEIEEEVGNAVRRIVDSADQPESADVQNAVKDHRASREELNYWTGLLSKINLKKNQ